MPVSKFLSKALGLYFLIISSVMFINMSEFLKHLHALVNDEPVMFLAGFITVILGILMVVAHNFWQWHWRLMITLIAWFTLIKGIVLLVHPVLIQEFSLSWAERLSFAYSGAVLDFVLGLIFLYAGFRSESKRA